MVVTRRRGEEETGNHCTVGIDSLIQVEGSRDLIHCTHGAYK
jgi:hypothetical protein